jgi:hypothetical protein
VNSEDLRLAVYRAFAETGRAPQVTELAGQLGADVTAVAAGLAELARDRHLVLDEAGRIVMAHPFSAVPLGFCVMGTRTLWWGGCAWDSFHPDPAANHHARQQGGTDSAELLTGYHRSKAQR